MADPALDINETARQWATKRSAQWRGAFPGWFVLYGIPIVAGGVATGIVTSHEWRTRAAKRVTVHHWPVAAQVIVPVACALILGLFIAGIVHAIYFAFAPTIQRNQARTRLTDIKDAAHRYSIVPIAVHEVEIGVRRLVKVEVENRGREGSFSAIIDGVEGSSLQLVNPHRHLLWEGRPGVYVDLIPSGEKRLIGAISTRGPRDADGNPKTLRFVEVGPDEQEGPRPTDLVKGKATIWIRVSLREGGEFGYSRRIGIVIDWAGPGDDFWVTLKESSPDDETETFAPSVATLLDY